MPIDQHETYTNYALRRAIYNLDCVKGDATESLRAGADFSTDKALEKLAEAAAIIQAVGICNEPVEY